MPRLTDSQVGKVHQMRREGASTSVIAAATGVSRSRVGELVRGDGVVVGYVRACDLCGEDFMAHRSHTRFCCPAHQQKFYGVYVRKAASAAS